MELARAESASAILDLREAGASRMKMQGIRQWEPGEVLLEQIAEQIAAGEWWLLRTPERVRGALRLLREDPEVWPDSSDDALYVHGLVVNEADRGGALGTSMLRWVEDRSRAHGKTLVRLDCVETNNRLRRYYAELGFHEVGRVTFEDPRWYPIIRMEKGLP